MAVKEEAELYPPLKQFFEARGYEVKGEVKNCDLVAVRPGEEELLIVEMKKTFNLALLLQGVERLRLSDQVILAVERNRKKSGAHNQRFGELTELCRMLGLGLITVTFFKTKAPFIEVLCEPGELPRAGRRRTREARLLQEFRERSGDYNIGGIRSVQLVTAYRERALRCAWALQAAGTAAPRRVAELSGCSKAADILQKDYYGWFERVERGVYRLRPAGTAALEQYAEIIRRWRMTVPDSTSSHN
ncbi:DUF2161 domain-containing phosphodiesterase [Paenibacillus sp. 1P07SE]|uniref:DUF2161 domain-containing phosphodiesterase n=1 Tax=Paenibacillus sp. 1P07SE TaxID=3132209 RepID=UPI0039A4C158